MVCEVWKSWPKNPKGHQRIQIFVLNLCFIVNIADAGVIDRKSIVLHPESGETSSANQFQSANTHGSIWNAGKMGRD